jgi:hypothetical protein
VLFDVVMVIVTLAEPVMLVELKFAVAPDGNPLTAR